jgi:hypothetical protein
MKTLEIAQARQRGKPRGGLFPENSIFSFIEFQFRVR